MSNIVIFGSSGFIGKYLLKYFDKEYNVVGLNSNDCNLLIIDEVNKIFDLFNENTIIIFASSIVRTIENSFDSHKKNVLMAQNISLSIAKNKVKIKQLIFLSTIDVYGIENDEIINENTLPSPNDFYSISKLSSEFILKKCCRENKTLLTILRLPGVYGKDEQNSTLGKMIKNAEAGYLTIFGNGSPTRDFLYIGDLYHIIVSCIKEKIFDVVNVVSGKSYSINEIAEAIMLLYPDVTIIHKKQIMQRQQYLVFNNSKLKSIIGNYKISKLLQQLQIIKGEKNV